MYEKTLAAAAAPHAKHGFPRGKKTPQLFSHTKHLPDVVSFLYSISRRADFKFYAS
jgi:hypothetical protein